MIFNSLDFLIFFPIVVLVYFILPVKIKNLWLLVSSYYFYMCWNAKYALLIFTSTFITYLSGIFIDKIKHGNYDDSVKNRYKKLVVAFSFSINLSILFFFKYFGFTLNILTKLFSVIGIQLSQPAFDIILPVGISFYTFQALSYTMDVYRDDIYAEKNFLQYALFVSFFPQLVAGPIERSKNLLKQLAVPQKFNFENARDGIMLMIWGFFLKLVIADRVAIFVDTVYGDYITYGGYYIVVATVLFAFQIYCDFYGYSTIATGASKILNIDLMDNFNYPYLSCSISEFWHNWHISLTSWFKDYLYIPLGGSRKGTLRKHINKVIVFLVSGLWHGAAFSFVVWGALNGIYQVLGEVLKPLRDAFVKFFKLNRESIGHKIIQGIITFALIDFSWVFFRAKSFTESIWYIKSILTVHNPWILFDGSLYTCGLDTYNFWISIISIIVLLISDCCKKKGISIRSIILKQDFWCRWLIITFSIMVVLILGMWGPTFDQNNFIYFQF